MNILYESGNEPALPATLMDCFLQHGFTYGPVRSFVRTPMAAGAAKQRRRHTVEAWELKGAIVVTTAQKPVLDAFIKDTLASGSKPFRKSDPLIETKNWLWRFTQPVVYTPFNFESWLVSFSLYRIPNTSQHQGLANKHLVDAAHAHLTDEYADHLTG